MPPGVSRGNHPCCKSIRCRAIGPESLVRVGGKFASFSVRSGAMLRVVQVSGVKIHARRQEEFPRATHTGRPHGSSTFPHNSFTPPSTSFRTYNP